MESNEYSKYIGRLKQPIQHPSFDKPSMYIICDSAKNELNLVLLTPGTFLHAYKFINSYNAKSVKIFIPSLRPEFISDITNLYLSLKDKIPVKWVFPTRTSYYTLEQGQIVTEHYTNQFDKHLSISYIENTKVEDVYDIVIKTSDSVMYFSMYIDESKVRELYQNKEYDFINVPKSSTMYGGLSYDDIIKIKRKYHNKFYPYDFSSIEELYAFMGKDISNYNDFI